jgi:hypothetical protein
MGVRLRRFAADAKVTQGLSRTQYSTPKFDPQQLDAIFNHDSKRIDGYPQDV